MRRLGIGAVAAGAGLGASWIAFAWLGWLFVPLLVFQALGYVFGLPAVFNLLHDLLGYETGAIKGTAYPPVVAGTGAAAGLAFTWAAGSKPAMRATLVAVSGFLFTGLVLFPLTGPEMAIFGLGSFQYQLPGTLAGLILFWILPAVLVWVLTRARRGATATDPARREALKHIGAFALVLAAGQPVIDGLARLGAHAQRAWAQIRGLSEEVTPVPRHYRVSKNVFDPAVDARRWVLRIRGLVEREVRLSYEALRALPGQVEQHTGLICVSNPVGGELIGSSLWRGVRLWDVLAMAGVRPGATKLILRGADDYSDSFPIQAARDPETLLVWEHNGSPLTQDHGHPARVLVPEIYGMKNCKWLVELELTDRDFKGYWQTRGWSDEAIVKTMSRIDTPGRGTILVAGETATIAGVAHAGRREIRRVEISTDGGRTWAEADLKPALSGVAWSLWAHDWTPPEPGRYTLQVRATDGTGAVQTMQSTPPLPEGASGYHAVVVNVR